MTTNISHDFQEETPEAKARWFASLTVSERMDMLCNFTDFILELNPSIFKDRVRINVQTSTPGLVFAEVWERRETMNYQGEEFYIVSRDDLIELKLAAGRPKDLDDVRMLRVIELDKQG